MPAPTAHLKFTADNSQQHEAVNQNLRDLDRQAQGTAQLGRSVGQLVAVFLSLQTAQQLLQSAKLGEDFLNARREFSRFVSDYEAGSQRLQQASKGTLSEIKTLQLANEAFRQGLDFSTVELAFQFAEQQADRTGDKIETVFEQVSRALAKTEAGVGRNNSILVRYGITGTNTVEILEQMNKQLEDQTGALDDNSDAVARFEAQWANAAANIGVAVRTGLLPALTAISDASQLLTEGTLANRIALISDRFAELRRRTGLDTGTSSNALSAQAILSNLTQSALRGNFTIQQAQLALAELQQLQSEAPKQLAGAYEEVISRVEDLIRKQQAVSTNTPFGPDERDAALNQELLDQQAAERERANREAQTAATEAANRRREALQQAREEAKLNIQLGNATYSDLKALLDQQAADNEKFFASDKAAYLAWLSDRSVVYQQDKQNAADAQAAIYNLYRNSTQEILDSDYLTMEEKFQMSREAIDFALQNEQLDLEQRRILSQEKQQIEQDYTNFILQEYNQQLQLYNNLFGQPALQLIDQFFSGAEVRFEDFLKNIVRNLAQYYGQMALFSLFGAILGNPFAGSAVGGLVGGGLRGGGGILSLPNIPDLTQLPQAPINNITRNFFPQPGNPQVSVQILATPEQLYAVTRTGQQQYNRSSGS